jgi:hypothetical protein
MSEVRFSVLWGGIIQAGPVRNPKNVQNRSEEQAHQKGKISNGADCDALVLVRSPCDSAVSPSYEVVGK